MLENQDMKSIMGIFAEKILTNLVFSKHDADESKRIISITLDTLSFYCGAISSCRMIANTEIMQKLIKNGFENFQILTHPSQLKELSQFYRILIQLWLNDDYMQTFEQNISQLNPLFEEVMATADLQLRGVQTNRANVIRLFYILRGLFRGAVTHKNFSILFDWFYPDYFGVVKKCLSCFIMDPCDDEVVLLILKFIGDLVDNSSNRLRFDTWSINGLIVYKEGASFII
jgi:exportin-7